MIFKTFPHSWYYFPGARPITSSSFAMQRRTVRSTTSQLIATAVCGQICEMEACHAWLHPVSFGFVTKSFCSNHWGERAWPCITHFPVMVSRMTRMRVVTDDVYGFTMIWPVKPIATAAADDDDEEEEDDDDAEWWYDDFGWCWYMLMMKRMMMMMMTMMMVIMGMMRMAMMLMMVMACLWCYWHYTVTVDDDGDDDDDGEDGNDEDGDDAEDVDDHIFWGRLKRIASCLDGSSCMFWDTQYGSRVHVPLEWNLGCKKEHQLGLLCPLGETKLLILQTENDVPNMRFIFHISRAEAKLYIKISKLESNEILSKSS